MAPRKSKGEEAIDAKEAARRRTEHQRLNGLAHLLNGFVGMGTLVVVTLHSGVSLEGTITRCDNDVPYSGEEYRSNLRYTFSDGTDFALNDVASVL